MHVTFDLPFDEFFSYFLAVTHKNEDWRKRKYSLLQLEPTFWGFPYKMTQGANVENHLKVMLNPSIFSQMLVLIWEADQ